MGCGIARHVLRAGRPDCLHVRCADWPHVVLVLAVHTGLSLFFMSTYYASCSVYAILWQSFWVSFEKVVLCCWLSLSCCFLRPEKHFLPCCCVLEDTEKQIWAAVQTMEKELDAVRTLEKNFNKFAKDAMDQFTALRWTMRHPSSHRLWAIVRDVRFVRQACRSCIMQN